MVKAIIIVVAVLLVAKALKLSANVLKALILCGGGYIVLTILGIL